MPRRLTNVQVIAREATGGDTSREIVIDPTVFYYLLELAKKMNEYLIVLIITRSFFLMKMIIS